MVVVASFDLELQHHTPARARPPAHSLSAIHTPNHSLGPSLLSAAATTRILHTSVAPQAPCRSPLLGAPDIDVDSGKGEIWRFVGSIEDLKFGWRNATSSAAGSEVSSIGVIQQL